MIIQIRKKATTENIGLMDSVDKKQLQRDAISNSLVGVTFSTNDIYATSTFLSGSMFSLKMFCKKKLIANTGYSMSSTLNLPYGWNHLDNRYNFQSYIFKNEDGTISTSYSFNKILDVVSNTITSTELSGTCTVTIVFTPRTDIPAYSTIIFIY